MVSKMVQKKYSINTKHTVMAWLFIGLILIAIYHFYSSDPKKRNIDLIKLLPIAKLSTDNYFDGLTLLDQVASSSACPYPQLIRCRVYSNHQTVWTEITNEITPVSPNNPWVLSFRLRNEQAGAGIILIGKPGKVSDQWWKGRIGLHILALFDRLEIYAYDGVTESGYLVFNEKMNTDFNGFMSGMILFDKNGENLLVADKNSQIMKKININQVTSGKLDSGIFPIESVYLGSLVGPKANLFISELVGLPLK